MPLTGQKVILEPPRPPQSKEFAAIVDYLKRLYDFNYLVWRRIGGYSPIDSGYQNMVYQNSNNIIISGGVLSNVAIDNAAIDGSTIQTSTLVGNDIQTGTITNSTISTTNLIDCQSKQGNSAFYIKFGGISNVNTIQKGNIGLSLQDLLSYNLPASSLNVDGSLIEIEAWGEFAVNANNKRIVLYFGSTVLIDTGLLALNSGSWVINATVVRTGASTQKSNAKLISSNSIIVASSNIATSAENTANVITVKIMGQGSLDNDVTQEGFIIKFFNK